MESTGWDLFSKNLNLFGKSYSYAAKLSKILQIPRKVLIYNGI